MQETGRSRWRAELHSITTQKIVLVVVTAVRNSDQTELIQGLKNYLLLKTNYIIMQMFSGAHCFVYSLLMRVFMVASVG
jgi:hypothetical protein